LDEQEYFSHEARVRYATKSSELSLAKLAERINAPRIRSRSEVK